MSNTFFLKLAKIFIFAAAFTPLLYKKNIIYPYLTGKLFFLRIVVELALISFIAYKALSINSFKEFKNDLKSFFSAYTKNALFIALIAFFVSLAISSAFAENSYRAFWGNLERGEGLVNFFHYLILLLLMIILFGQRDWFKFFAISLGVGMVAIFYGFLQSAGMMNFPFMPQGGASERAGSFIGNPAFFGAYLTLIVAVGGIIIGFVSKKWLKGLVYSAMALSLIMIFFTRTRGVVLGLGAGIFVLLIYFAFRPSNFKTFKPLNFETLKPLNFKTLKHLNIRAISIILLSLTIIFSAVFWLTKDAAVWQKIPGFDRLAKTAFLNSNDASVQTRLIAWQSSLKAFKERPFIGWGLEGYLTAYSKHYDPKYAVYGETWLDRSHNKLIDVLVMQGVFGVLAYLVLWGLLFRAFRRQPLVLAALVAYFVQNFFVFDEINSYLIFFPILGFAIVYFANKNSAAEGEEKPLKDEKWKLLVAILAALLIFLFGYFYNYIPYSQAKTANLIYNTRPTPENQKIIIEYLKNSFYPYNFAQSSIRNLLFDRFHNTADGYTIFDKPQFDLLSKEMEKSINEIIEAEPNYDPRYYLRKNQILFIFAKRPGNEALFKEAETTIRKGMEMAPRRQEFYYGLAFNLVGQGRYEEAVKAAQTAVELNSQAPRAYYYLGLMYAIVQKKAEALESLDMVQKLDPDLSSLNPFDSAGLILAYKIIGNFDRIAELVIRRIDGENMINASRDDYLLTLKYFADKRDAENFIKVAAYLKQFNDLKDDMEVLIDLAEKGMWDIIHNL